MLGIEFGSTRIKAVLIDENHHSIASGDYEWENRLENGIWTYSLDDIWQGLRDSYQKLAFNVEESYGVTLKKIGAIGFSAMMHGYMAFDKKWRTSCSIPHMEKWNHRGSLRGTYRSFSVQYSSEMEHCSFVSGNLKWRRPCKGY